MSLRSNYPITHLTRLIGVAMVSAACAATGASCSDSDDGEEGDTVGTTQQWNLVWSDEFNEEAGTPPNPNVWTPEVGGDGWGNQQLEFNSDRLFNAAHNGAGSLAIVARQEDFGNNNYTSARLSTEGNVSVQYGRIEARIRQPVGAGIWPAFWMLGENFRQVGWPSCGEIDIMEYRGQEPAITHGTIHGPGYSGGQGITERVAISGGGLNQDFHVYAIEWEPNEIRWFVDDIQYHSVTPDDLPGSSPWVYDQPFFMILNIAVGGTFVGPLAASTTFPQTMLIDYVRVYEGAL